LDVGIVERRKRRKRRSENHDVFPFSVKDDWHLMGDIDREMMNVRCWLDRMREDV